MAYISLGHSGFDSTQPGINIGSEVHVIFYVTLIYLRHDSNSSCGFVEPYAALLIGMGSAPLTIQFSRALKQNVSRFVHYSPAQMGCITTDTHATLGHTHVHRLAFLALRADEENKITTSAISSVVFLCAYLLVSNVSHMSSVLQTYHSVTSSY